MPEETTQTGSAQVDHQPLDRYRRLCFFVIVCIYIPAIQQALALFLPVTVYPVRVSIALFSEWSLFGLIFFLLSIEGLKPRDIWFGSDHIVREVLLGLVLVVIFWSLVWLILGHLAFLRSLPGVSNLVPATTPTRIFSFNVPPLTWNAALVFCFAITAGICEETVFRGYLLSRALKLIPNKFVAVPFALLVSSIFFGLLHLPAGTGMFVVSSFGGLCCTVLVLWRRDLTSAIVAHTLFNIQGWYLG